MKRLRLVFTAVACLASCAAHAEIQSSQHARFQMADGAQVSLDYHLLTYNYFGAAVAEASDATLTLRFADANPRQVKIHVELRKVTAAGSGTLWTRAAELSPQADGSYAAPLEMPDNLAGARFELRVTVEEANAQTMIFPYVTPAPAAP